MTVVCLSSFGDNVRGIVGKVFAAGLDMVVPLYLSRHFTIELLGCTSSWFESSGGVRHRNHQEGFWDIDTLVLNYVCECLVSRVTDWGGVEHESERRAHPMSPYLASNEQPALARLANLTIFLKSEGGGCWKGLRRELGVQNSEFSSRDRRENHWSISIHNGGWNEHSLDDNCASISRTCGSSQRSGAVSSLWATWSALASCILFTLEQLRAAKYFSRLMRLVRAMKNSIWPSLSE